jgi:hypothetical protein
MINILQWLGIMNYILNYLLNRSLKKEGLMDAVIVESDKAFGVVAEEMKNRAANAEFAFESIPLPSKETNDTLKNLYATGRKLKEVFQSSAERQEVPGTGSKSEMQKLA